MSGFTKGVPAKARSKNSIMQKFDRSIHQAREKDGKEACAFVSSARSCTISERKENVE